MLPTLISVSLAPGSYRFCATAGVAASATSPSMIDARRQRPSSAMLSSPLDGGVAAAPGSVRRHARRPQRPQIWQRGLRRETPVVWSCRRRLLADLAGRQVSAFECDWLCEFPYGMPHAHTL